MKSLLFTAVFLCVGLVAFNRQNWQVSDRLSDTSGFDLVSDTMPLKAPPGWTVEKVEGKEFLFGPTFNGLRCNVSMVIEESELGLAAYSEANKASLASLPNGYRLVTEGGFKTTGGITGLRLVWKATFSGVLFRQTMYVFEAPGNRKHIFTGTVPDTRGDEMAGKFDEIVRTYHP